MDPAWLLRDGDVLAAIEKRRRGWRGSVRGVVMLRRPAVLPTTRPLDVASCKKGPDGALEVCRIRKVARYRVAPALGLGGAVLVAPAGSFERWKLRVGDQLELK